ncbi:unnamed protein product, partial [Symbiodinium sp. CCMP2456]
PRFAFLKAFLLDKDQLATITVSPYFEELSENKEKETFEELPLALIKEKYEHLPGGPKLIADILAIYKIFKNVATSSANIHRVGSKTTGTKTASTNKAERTAIAEAIEGKVADMTKMITGSASGAKGKGRGNGKSKGKKELTAEEAEAKAFQKDL